MSLSERLRDCEAAPWVIEEIKKLEAKNSRLKIALRNISNETLIYNGVPEIEMIGDIARAALEEK